MPTREFDEFFGVAAGHAPFPYQRRLATGNQWPPRIEVPTGLGKTLAVVVGWLWCRRAASQTRSATPRRLVYCLPMRVLVEQTRDVVRNVIQRLDLATRVVVLMGGVDDGGDWDTQPEDDAIVLGTQDMLLSRALNRGYGMSRYRWPLHYGLLNNDCLWVIDEVQLVGSGVATTAQLQALRRKLGTVMPTHTSWMSATLEERWLRTVDVEDVDTSGRLALEDEDLADPVVAKRIGARKLTGAASSTMGDMKSLAAEIIANHRPGTRTLAIVNTVARAQELFEQLRKTKPSATLVLLHSRFRAAEREQALDRARATPSSDGTIVVSTQVVEAGVDLTSATLFTEMAPWASLVQRFGRCNRRGEDDGAQVRWVGLPKDEKERAKVVTPYNLEDLVDSQNTMAGLSDVGLASLPKKALRFEQGLMLRRRDLLDLFDTTPDMMGNDVDVSRFIRDADDHDLRVCWRDFDGEPQNTQRAPTREELCAVPIGIVREWVTQKRPRAVWTWDGLRRNWVPADKVHPGLTLLLRCADGGYDPVLGLAPKSGAFVAPVPVAQQAKQDDREYDGDPDSEWPQWYTLINHSDEVVGEANILVRTLSLPPHLADPLVTAARWHDAGKVHPVWQTAAKKIGSDPPLEPVAKSRTQKGRIVYERKGFRHELASALLALQHAQTDLVCFLIACHHGKVRVSLRALPTEAIPMNDAGHDDPSIRHARGIWEGDLVPAVTLGARLTVAATTLTLRYMELGDDDATGPSWLSRVLSLRDDSELGPFRLGFLEALIKCADERTSRRAAVKEDKA